MLLKNFFFLLVLIWLQSSSADDPKLELIHYLKTDRDKGSEILDIQNETRRLIVVNGVYGIVDIYTINTDGSLKPLVQHDLELKAGEEATAIGFHPTQNIYLVPIQNSDVSAPGRVEVRRADTGEIINSIVAGIGPDGLAIDKSGTLAIVPNEGEYFTFNQASLEFETGSGSVTLLRNVDRPEKITSHQIPLDDVSGMEGWLTSKHRRYLHRDADWNGNDTIENVLDFNGNGEIEDNYFTISRYKGHPVFANEKNGETFFFKITDSSPEFLEPERAVFNSNGSKAYVVIQESNGVVVIDTKAAKVDQYFGLGLSHHKADLEKNDKIEFNKMQSFLREPDGIDMTPDGLYFITADEGDTEYITPKDIENSPAGGARSISIFNAENGSYVGDTGSQLDEWAAKKNVYPDKRSQKKGSEPETVKAFSFNNIAYAVVTLERADSLALVSLEEISKPRVIDVVAIGKDVKLGGHAPEGLDVFWEKSCQCYYAFSANEKSGSIAVFKIF